MKIVFDLDDTLADSSERVNKYLWDGDTRVENPDWEAFFAECSNDKPIWPIIHLYKLLEDEYDDNDIKIWTARDNATRTETLKWLRKHGIRILNSNLTMRLEGDRTDDDELKRMWLKTHMAAGWKPDLVFEDRKRIVDMYRKEGIRCVQVADGDF